MFNFTKQKPTSSKEDEKKFEKLNFMQFASRNKKGIAALTSLLLGFLLSFIVISIMGYDPIEIIQAMFRGSFQDQDQLWQTIQTTSLFTLLGLAVGLGFKAGLFNIGVAGQMVFAAMNGYMFAYANPTMDPGMLTALIVVIALLSAAAFGLVAGILKAAFGVHEVITTIMLNWISVKVIQGVMDKDKANWGSSTSVNKVPQSDVVNSLIPSISAYVTWALFAAIIAVIAIFVLFKYTKLGMKIKITGNNVNAGKYAGYRSKTILVGVMTASAIIAGFAAVCYYFGEANNPFGNSLQKDSLSVPPIIGFTGIAISLVALNNPIATVPVALLFAVLQGQAAISEVKLLYHVPTRISELFGSIIIYFVAISNLFIYILTPTKIKKFVIKINNFYQNENISLQTKILTSIFNVLTIGIYTYAHNNWNWVSRLNKKEVANV